MNHENPANTVAELKIRLCEDIKRYIAENNLSNSKAAEVFGVQRKRIIDIQQQRIEKGFTIDYLVEMLERVGLRTIKHNAA